MYIFISSRFDKVALILTQNVLQEFFIKSIILIH